MRENVKKLVHSLIGCRERRSAFPTGSLYDFLTWGTNFWFGLAIPTPPESHRYLPTVQPRNRLDR